ncbi:MAG TPA: hypothetical protein VMT15_07650 [Bryobacteraceae bacterium]|nr:hypothetical protein [Bryobacteraceae bacterium]
MRIQIRGLFVLFVLAIPACPGQGIITTVAGTSTCCNNADGGLAINTWIESANGIAMDAKGNLYIWNTQKSEIKKVTAAGIITTFAGNGTAGYTGDNGSAINASLAGGGSVSGIAVDSAGSVYISDYYNHAIRKVDTAGVITTYAGTGSAGYLGDGGPANKALLNFPAGIAVDGAGNLYVADSSNNRVRMVNTAGIISTVAGNGNVVYSGDGVQATTTAVDRPEGVTVDSQGNLYISETSDSRVRRVAPNGIISTLAGQTKKTTGFSGDGGPATAATLAGPCGLAVDGLGNLYIADNSNGRIRKVDAAGIITTYAGITGNASSPLGDGGPATGAYLGTPKDVVSSPSRDLYIAGMASSGRVRKVAAGTGAGFAASPTSLTFAYTIGGAAPAAQSVNLTSTGSALTFTTSISTQSGGNWLSATPPSGTTPASLSVSVSATGLAGGTYQGTITVTPGGSGNSPLAYIVTLNVTGAGAPTIKTGGIVNAVGYQAKLAPDTVFVIFGNNLGPASLALGTAPNYPTNLLGTSITFTPTAGGAAIPAKIVYTVASQVAGLLPSSIAPGTYAVQVTYNSLTSASQNVTVVPRSIGIATANSAGTGTAQATIANINSGLSLTRFTAGSVAFGGYNWTLGPAHPGDTLVLWGTGGGADPANDVGGSSGDQTAAGSFIVNVDGRQITPLYAGTSSGYPGLWQVNFTLPADTVLDCFAAVQVSAGGELSNAVNIPIAASGQTSCVDPSSSATLLGKLDSGVNITLGAFAIAKITATDQGITQETASGAVFSYTPAEWITLNSGPLFAACRVYDRTYPVGGKDPGAPDANLDAGSKLPLAGPGLPAGFALSAIATSTGPVYSNSPSAGTLTAGTYTLTGLGGAQVGAFSTSTLFPASFTATNWDSITLVDRTKPLVFTWSGSGFDQVAIIVSSAVRSGSTQHITTINCTVPGAPGSYSIPAAALAYLSPGASSGINFGTISLQAISAPGKFTASLAQGGQLDMGLFGANLGVAKNIAVQ